MTFAFNKNSGSSLFISSLLFLLFLICTALSPAFADSTAEERKAAFEQLLGVTAEELPLSPLGPNLATSFRPSDGYQETRVQLDNSNCDDITIFQEETSVVYKYTCTIFPEEAGGNPDFLAELRMEKAPDGSITFNAEAFQIPADRYLEALGITHHRYDIPGEAAIFPVYGGYLVEEPGSTLTSNINTVFGNSMQFIAYAGEKNGFLHHITDPDGMSVFSTVYNRFQDDTGDYIAITLWVFLEYTPQTQQLSLPFSHRFLLVPGDWFDVAMAYKAWLLSHAQDGILKRGKDRADNPDCDLLLTEEEHPVIPERLYKLRDFEKVYGTRINEKLRLCAMLWNLFDVPNEVPERYGTYSPGLGFPEKLKELQSDNIWVGNYTFPARVNAANSLVSTVFNNYQPLSDLIINNLDGTAFLDVIKGESLNALDLAHPFWPDTFYPGLAEIRRKDHKFSLLYADLPAEMVRDHHRPAGTAIGYSRRFYEGYAESLNAFRKEYMQAGMPHMIAAEASFERLIPYATHTLAYDWRRVVKGSSKSYSVPFTQALYNEYIDFLFGDPTRGILSYSLGFQGPVTGTNHAPSYLLAHGALWGRIINLTEPLWRAGILVGEIKEGMGFNPFLPVFNNFTKTVQDLLYIQNKYKGWLKDGELLRDPAVDGDQETLAISIRNEGSNTSFIENFTTYKVATSAFKHDDYGIAAFVFNSSPDPARIELDLSRIGLGVNNSADIADLESGTSYKPINNKLDITLDSHTLLVLSTYDECPEDHTKYTKGVCGCGVADTDSDNDEVLDCNDSCPNDPNKTEAGICGCGLPDIDSDLDGVLDCNDACPGNRSKSAAGQCGCALPDTDSDLDGIADCNDRCPNNSLKSSPGLCGCNAADTDTDSDGTPDCNDECPSDSAKVKEGLCGCGSNEADSDGDKVPDCVDLCPDNAEKIKAGQCGCGTADIDSDQDGMADCLDQCPQDQNKTRPEQCGCGTPDADLNQNGILDCLAADTIQEDLDNLAPKPKKADLKTKKKSLKKIARDLKRYLSAAKSDLASSDSKKVKKLIRRSRKLTRRGNRRALKKAAKFAAKALEMLKRSTMLTLDKLK